nr:phycobiliprotein lyase [Cavernulicola chilensis]
MDLEKILQQFEGKWFVQRTTYKLNSRLSKTDQGETKAYLNTLDNSANKLGKQNLYKLPANLELISYKKIKKTSSVLIMLFPLEKDYNFAKVALFIDRNKLLLGHCYYNNRYSVSFIYSNKGLIIEDKIWFANQNLKLVTTSIRENRRIIYTSFASEIKIGDS